MTMPSWKRFLVFAAASVVSSVSACSTWTQLGEQLAVGVYSPCTCISRQGLHLVFDGDGRLSLRDSLDPVQYHEWWSNGVTHGTSLHVTTDGNAKVLNGDSQLWSVFPQTNSYPGKPVDDKWALAIDGSASSPGIHRAALVYNDTSQVWNSESGVVFATRKLFTDELTRPNEYIQGEDSYLLVALNGDLCAFDGSYPDSRSLRACIPKFATLP
jgi:hypothetical protein